MSQNMHQRQLLTELNILRFSVLLELFFGITGVLVALYSGSQAVLLDGSYSLICTLTMMANVRVSQLVKQPPSIENPYGHPTLEPMMLILEGLILLGLCITLMAASTYKLFTGGYTPEFDLALGYEIFSTIIGGAAATAFFLLNRSRPSPLIYFEFQEWLVDTAVSAAAAAAFSIAYLLGSDHPVTPYIDSSLTLSLVLILTLLPLKTVLKNIKQLLLQDSASPKLIEKVIDAISKQNGIIPRQNIHISMIWLGRWLWVNIDIEVYNNTHLDREELKSISNITESIVSSVCKFYRLKLSFNFPEK
ncbi:cation transporter [Endozoicomonas elysicola]|uniref:Cation efflux protein transmembrane domain-containing protein n=2 Tax=Endozoicomonas elysicola TaxID=305900 RepID=A0A081KDT2_9GAMM|nr:hypothetical protein GV64_17645 [Endozoicomonas elysicola]